MKHSVLFTLLCILSLSLPSIAFAASGTISVTAVDQSGKKLSGISFQCSDIPPRGSSVMIPAPTHSTLVTNGQGVITWSVGEVDGHKFSCYPKDVGKCMMPGSPSSPVSNVTLSGGESKQFTYSFKTDPNCSGGSNSGTTAVPTGKKATATPKPTIAPTATVSLRATDTPFPVAVDSVAKRSILERILDFFKSLFK